MSFFFFNDPAPTEIYTLSLHDALPICVHQVLEVLEETRYLTVLLRQLIGDSELQIVIGSENMSSQLQGCARSEEHTSELQSPYDLVCRLLLEKKKKKDKRK